MKNIFLALLFILAIVGKSYSQDGSNIRYVKTKNIDSTYIGQFVQFDFYKRSFGDKNKDTITLIIDSNPILFIENRSDDGYENWFSNQYLQSFEKQDGEILHVSKFKLDKVLESSFHVTMYVEYYNLEDKLIPNKSLQLEYVFDKENILEVLINMPFQ